MYTKCIRCKQQTECAKINAGEGQTFYLCRKCGEEANRNEQVMKDVTMNFLMEKYNVNSSVTPEKKGCFIATAVYGNPNYPKVILFKCWRDTRLMRTHIGRLFVAFYYAISPHLAKIISRHFILKRGVRCILDIIANTLNRIMKININQKI